MSQEVVRISGLRELRAGLRRIDKKLPKEISKAGKKAANIVVRSARPRVPVGPAVGGHAAVSIKPRATQKGVSVVEGGNKFPYMPWLDFGGTIYPRGAITHGGRIRESADFGTGRQQAIHRPYLKRGRYVWAAFGDNKSEVMDTYQNALGDAARRAGLEVH